MPANICGNCKNFKLTPNQKFYNCTVARHAGVRYGMQVRPDTTSCDAFAPPFAPAKAAVAPVKNPPAEQRAEPEVVGLCPWGRAIMVLSLLIIIVWVVWIAASCYARVSG